MGHTGTQTPTHIGHIFMDTATDMHAVCIFPFRVYEVRGMILYAKSSLELIVNNRIGKVGIQPVLHPPSPRRGGGDLRVSFTTGDVCSGTVLVYVSNLSVVYSTPTQNQKPPPSSSPASRYARECDICALSQCYLRIITYKRVILSYTSSLVNDN